MKFRYLPILAAAVVAVGCGSKSGSGDVATNTDTKSSTTTTGTSTTSGSAGSSDTTGSSTTTGNPSGTTGTTGTSPTPVPPTGGAPKPGPGSPPPAMAQGAPGTPGSAPAMTPEQQKARQAQMQKLIEDQKKMQENGDKAAKATKTKLDGVEGTYKIEVDESKFPPQAKADPRFKQLEESTIVISADGSLTATLGPKPLSGFTSKVDGKPALILTLPDAAKAGGPTKQFAPVTVSDGGATLTLGQFKFKRK